MCATLNPFSVFCDSFSFLLQRNIMVFISRVEIVTIHCTGNYWRSGENWATTCHSFMLSIHLNCHGWPENYLQSHSCSFWEQKSRVLQILKDVLGVPFLTDSREKVQRLRTVLLERGLQL